MQACRLQIASVSFAICKRAVFKEDLFSEFKFFLCSFLCKLQGSLCTLQACSLQIAIVRCFLLTLTPFSRRITHPRVAKGWQGLPRVGSGCQGLAELPRSAEGCQGLPEAAKGGRGCKGMAGVSKGCQRCSTP